MGGRPDTGTALETVSKAAALFSAASQEDVDQFIRASDPFTREELQQLRDSEGRSLLHHTCKAGMIRICDLLLNSYGLDVGAMDSEGVTPLCLAAGGNHLEVVRLLASHGADLVNAPVKNAAPIHRAAASGSVEVLAYLLDEGCDVNLGSPTGPPLCWAAGTGALASVKLLCSRGADVNLCGPEDVSPLLMAAASASLECVELLLEKGADVNKASLGGTTALHAAALLPDEKSADDVTELLIQAGADPNRKDGEGHVPLVLAAYKHNRLLVGKLLPHTHAVPGVEWTVDGVVKYAEGVGPARSTGASVSSGGSTGSRIVSIEEPEKEDPERALGLKDEGDAAFRSGNYEEALQKYTESLRWHTRNALVWANRSAAHLKLGQADPALEDALKSRVLDPGYAKAWYREGHAYEAMKKWQEAAEAYFEAARLDPDNMELARCFQHAIDKGRKEYQEKLRQNGC